MARQAGLPGSSVRSIYFIMTVWKTLMVVVAAVLLDKTAGRRSLLLLSCAGGGPWTSYHCSCGEGGGFHAQGKHWVLDKEALELHTLGQGERKEELSGCTLRRTPTNSAEEWPLMPLEDRGTVKAPSCEFDVLFGLLSRDVLLPFGDLQRNTCGEAVGSAGKR